MGGSSNPIKKLTKQVGDLFGMETGGPMKNIVAESLNMNQAFKEQQGTTQTATQPTAPVTAERGTVIGVQQDQRGARRRRKASSRDATVLTTDLGDEKLGG